MDESLFVLVLVTFGSLDEARTFSETAVAEQLAACVNLLPRVESIYRWKGAVERSEEIMGVVKTTRERLTALEACYRSLHSYEVPEFLILSVSGGGADYLKWLGESVSGARA